MSISYFDFLAQKAPKTIMRGIEPEPMPSHLFDFQRECIAHNLRCGSAGLFLDTGLGKTACELEYARQGGEATNGKSLIFTPLAVARQVEREGLRWDYDCHVIKRQEDVREGINIINYDRLHLIDPSVFGAVVLDEGSIIKGLNGKTSKALIQAFDGCKFKLPATATPAPNDHMEIGQYSEFCSIMPMHEMLMRWFTHDSGKTSAWRLKHHGAADFFAWMASWSRMAQMPSDLGYSDDDFRLPELKIHTIHAEQSAIVGGDLFGDAPVTATEMHNVKRQTAEARAKEAAELVTGLPNDPWVLWCDTDYEADALMRILKGIPGVAEVRGSHSSDCKESTLLDFADGVIRVLVTKSSICGFGLNWQFCANTAFVGRSFSYESWYQAIRRFWRFGQKRIVNCYVIVAQGENAIGRVIDRKADDHMMMKSAMRKAMRQAIESSASQKIPYSPKHNGRIPAWL